MPFRPRVVVIHPLVQPKFDILEKQSEGGKQPAQAIRKSLQTAVARIKNDGQWGEVIPTDSIPRIYVSRYGIKNLYCVDLAHFYRLLYTIRERDVVIVDLVDHAEYDRLMKD